MEVGTFEFLFERPAFGELSLSLVIDVKMIGIDTTAQSTICVHSAHSCRVELVSETDEETFRRELGNRTVCCHCTVLFKVASKLMQRKMDDTTENGKDLVGCVEPLFELNIAVPERMRQKVKSYTGCSTLK